MNNALRILALASILPSGPVKGAFAENTGGYAGFRGLGATSCELFVTLSNDDRMKNSLTNWAYGFWTGLNLGLATNDKAIGIEANLFDASVSPEALRTRILARCFESADRQLADILSELFWELPRIN